MALDILKKNKWYIRPWQEYLLAIVLLSIIIFQAYTLSKFVQLPGPIYGGDEYYHFGIINHLYSGGSLFVNSNYANSSEYYPWLFHLNVLVIGKILGVSAFTAMVWFPIFITLISTIIIYLLIKKFVSDKTLALISAITWLIYSCGFAAVSTTYSFLVIWPLFIYSILYFDKRWSSIFIGLVYGLTGITHVTVFLAASLFLVLFFIWRLIRHKETWKADLQKLGIIGLIGVAIAMLYWWAPIFIYHGVTPNNWQEYADSGVAGLNIGYLLTTFGQIFFNTTNGAVLILSIIALAGCGIALFNFKKKYGILIIILLTILVGLLHPIITSPLLHTSFGYYRFSNLLPLCMIMGFSIILSFIKDSITNKILRIFLIIAMLLLTGVAVGLNVESQSQNQWITMASTSNSQIAGLYKTANNIKQSTDINSVFITPHVETSFALNALTGRKIVSMRITHASPFVDANQRIADNIVMLYGNNSKTITSLIKQYNVSYFYTDVYAQQASSLCINYWNKMNGNTDAYTYNCFRTSPKYKDYLEANGIQTQEILGRLDIASYTAPIANLLIAKPNNGSVFIKKLTFINEGNYSAYFKVQQ